jgi:hypothetical protein
MPRRRILLRLWLIIPRIDRCANTESRSLYDLDGHFYPSFYLNPGQAVRRRATVAKRNSEFIGMKKRSKR